MTKQIPQSYQDVLNELDILKRGTAAEIYDSLKKQNKTNLSAVAFCRFITGLRRRNLIKWDGFKKSHKTHKRAIVWIKA